MIQGVPPATTGFVLLGRKATPEEVCDASSGEDEPAGRATCTIDRVPLRNLTSKQRFQKGVIFFENNRARNAGQKRWKNLGLAHCLRLQYRRRRRCGSCDSKMLITPPTGSSRLDPQLSGLRYVGTDPEPGRATFGRSRIQSLLATSVANGVVVQGSDIFTVRQLASTRQEEATEKVRSHWEDLAKRLQYLELQKSCAHKAPCLKRPKSTLRALQASWTRR